MPAPFGPEEQANIRKDLLEAGRNSFSRFGIRKTTVDMLCREAGIAKGSFYRFFPSKEELFMELMEEEERKMREQLTEELRHTRSFAEAEDCIVHTYRRAGESGILGLLTESGELAALARKLPEERLRQHRDNDEELSVALIRIMEEAGFRTRLSADLISAMLRGLFTVTFHRKEVGSDIFPRAHGEMVRAVLRDAFDTGADYDTGR